MRLDVSFASEGEDCVGWLYLPDDVPEGQKLPAIVMANAITAVKEMVLPVYAERFAAAGFADLAFDFRYLGASGGEPRYRISAADQIDDLRNAISWLGTRPEIDPNRIGAWGASFGGAHVLYLASFDKRLKAAVSSVPSMRAVDTMIHFMGREGLGKVQGFLGWDRSARYQSGQVTTMKAVSDGSENAMLPNPEANAFFPRLGSTIAPSWRNEVTVESVERLIEYDPAVGLDLISPTPLLMVVAEQDQSQPAEVSTAAFARIGEPKRLVTVAAGHTAMLEQPEHVAAASDAAIDWFRQHLG
jgi:fermentation-respiration switch protein FrsA (DUF1100 family)